MQKNHTCTNSSSTAIFSVLEKIFCRHTVSVRKHTAQLYNAKYVPTSLVCYSVAIRAKFDAYLNTFLIETEYKKVPSIGKNFKFAYDVRFPLKARDILYRFFKSINPAIFKFAVLYTNFDTCLK